MSTQTRNVPPNGSAQSRKLHVVIHGLIAIRYAQKQKSVELHIPTVGMHVYRAGSIDQLKPLDSAHDYELSGVQPAHMTPDLERMVDEFIVLSIGQRGLHFEPNKTHATVRLPWPFSIKCVRPLEKADNPLFNEGVNPRDLGYISYLSYKLRDDERPLLHQGSKRFWSSDAPGPSTRLHFYADPAQALSSSQYPQHMHEAYTAFNTQLFAPAFGLLPNITQRMLFSKSANSPDIPDNEAVDLWQIGQIQPHIDGSGNCMPIHLLD